MGHAIVDLLLVVACVVASATCWALIKLVRSILWGPSQIKTVKESVEWAKLNHILDEVLIESCAKKDRLIAYTHERKLNRKER